MANQISIKDPQTAKQWLQTVEIINRDYYSAMKDAGDALNEMTQYMDGTIVDEIASVGTNMLDAAKTTYDAIDKIADTVNTILNTVKQFSDGIVSGISAVAKSIFG